MDKIRFIKDGNIFDSDCQMLVNPVNCEGVMGKGLAKAFKDKYPNYFIEYKKVCGRLIKEPHMFKPLAYMRMIHKLDGYDKDLLSFPTKIRWRDDSDMNFIDMQMDNLIKLFETADYMRCVKSIAFPKLGCGCGGLEWDEVKEMLKPKLNDIAERFDVRIEVYE